MATNPEQGDFLEDDEQDELARRSILSAGWFRALLVLTVLAIVVVVSLPYLLNWLEPTSAPPPRTQAKSSAPAPAPAPTPAPAPAPVPGPRVTSPPAPSAVQAPAPPVPPTKAEAPAPAPPAPTSGPPKAGPVPAPAPPSPADRPLGTAPPPAAPTTPATATKSEPATRPASKAAPAPQTAPATKAEPATKPAPVAQAEPATKPAPAAQAGAAKSAPTPKRSPAAGEGSQEGYWVQVGAFLEARNAEALAKQLRGEKFPVQVSVVTRGGMASQAPVKSNGGLNQLFITGSTPHAVNAALKGKGTAQAVKGGVVVDPSFDLETAMSLSSSLKKDGFKVAIRPAKAEPAKAGGGPTYHVVRVGGYADRVKAQQARGELQAKGLPGFVTQGAAR